MFIRSQKRVLQDPSLICLCPVSQWPQLWFSEKHFHYPTCIVCMQFPFSYACKLASFPPRGHFFLTTMCSCSFAQKYLSNPTSSIGHFLPFSVWQMIVWPNASPVHNSDHKFSNFLFWFSYHLALRPINNTTYIRFMERQQATSSATVCISQYLLPNIQTQNFSGFQQ